MVFQLSGEVSVLESPGLVPAVQLTGRARTIPKLLDTAAELFGDRTAWTDGVKTRTFRELPQIAALGATALKSRGLAPGDRIVVIAENRIETLELLIASAWFGTTVVPINPATPPAQLEYFLNYVEPSWVFFEGGPHPITQVTQAPWEELPARVIGDPRSSAANCWINANQESPVHQAQPDTPLTILMTSGTTGVSKGVTCPQGQFIAWGETVAHIFGMTSQDTAYTCLPLFHTNALNAAFQCLVTGAKFHLGPRFSSSRFWDRIIDAEATATYLLGAMVSMLLNIPTSAQDRSHSVSRILAPGTPTPALHAFEERFDTYLIEAHGMTETNAAIGTPLGERRVGYMGRVMPGFQALAVNEFDEPVPEGQPGELILRSDIPYAFASGYWRLPEVTVSANRNQWFHTGDRVVSDQGWFRFVDRIKDVIRRRGENISAWEVEHVLDEYPNVAKSAVVPVPSELGEDEVMAFILTTDRTRIDPIELRQHCASQLAPFAIPRFIEFVEELPLTETGKVRKQVLRERGVGAETWDADDDQRSSPRT